MATGQTAPLQDCLKKVAGVVLAHPESIRSSAGDIGICGNFLDTEKTPGSISDLIETVPLHFLMFVVPLLQNRILNKPEYKPLRMPLGEIGNQGFTILPRCAKSSIREEIRNSITFRRYI